MYKSCPSTLCWGRWSWQCWKVTNSPGKCTFNLQHGVQGSGQDTVSPQGAEPEHSVSNGRGSGEESLPKTYIKIHTGQSVCFYYKTKLPCLIYQNSKNPTTHKKRRNHFPVLSGRLLITDQDKWHLQKRWNLVNRSGPETLKTVILCKMQELPWDIWHSSPWQFIGRISSFTYLCKAKALFFIWTLTL